MLVARAVRRWWITSAVQALVLAACSSAPAPVRAFLATDRLLRRSSTRAFVIYFGLFADSADRTGNFRLAFGVELDEFVREFDAEFGRLGRRPQDPVDVLPASCGSLSPHPPRG